LRELGFAILERDVKSSDAATQQLALFGISMTADEHAISFFQDALRSRDPALQLYALRQLCQYQEACAESALKHAMSSPYILLRLEAAYLLATGRFPSALSQVDALMQKCPCEILPLFPIIISEITSDGAVHHMRKLLMNPSQDVRLSAVLSIAKKPNEVFIPYIRTLASQNDSIQSEACAYALGVMKDSLAVPLLIKLTHSHVMDTSLAACLALKELGYKAYEQKIVDAALKGNPFAIHTLNEIDNTNEILLSLIQRGDSCIRANAAIAFIHSRDARAPQYMLEYLSPISPQPPLIRVMSNGKSLYAYKTAPLNLYDTPVWDTACELSLQEREKWLVDCYACGEEPFLKLALQLIQRRQNDVIPTVFRLLQQSLSSECDQFLEMCCRMPGYPLVRNYALIALLKRGEKETCYAPLKEWVVSQWESDILEFRPTISPWQAIDNDLIQSDLKPNETAKLFLDAIDVLIAEQDEATVDLILEAIEKSHRKLHPIFAAILVRLVQ
jgi:HEAT repeat protein